MLQNIEIINSLGTKGDGYVKKIYLLFFVVASIVLAMEKDIFTIGNQRINICIVIVILITYFSIRKLCMQLVPQHININHHNIYNFKKELKKINKKRVPTINIELTKIKEELAYELGIELNQFSNIRVNYSRSTSINGTNFEICDGKENYMITSQNFNRSGILWIAIADIYVEKVKKFVEEKNHIIYEPKDISRFTICDALFNEMRVHIDEYKEINIITSVQIPMNIRIGMWCDTYANTSNKTITVYNFEKQKETYTERKRFGKKN